MKQHTRLNAAPMSVALLVAMMASAPVLASGGHGADDGNEITFGAPGSASSVDRTVEIVMTDNAFSLPALDVQAGETIRFVLKNEGSFLHEFALATPEMHMQHEAEMADMFADGMLSVLGSKDPDLANQMNAGQMAGGMAMAAPGHMTAGAAHLDSNATLVDPGDSTEIIWTFAATDAKIEFACTVPGHYESGMVGAVRIRA
ncbi:MAG: plastocyanin/azurin family copper-binding protein [Pseudorhodobacter sp.]|nr:plastocyanin/azurin family copper-binding protein [Pseudorhodobacter sp.]